MTRTPEHASPMPIESPTTRRGNTLVLVTAILVLLVIIATAFITRTQDGRKLATVQGHAFQREESASIYADQLATEISRSLFPASVDPGAQAEAYGYFTNGAPDPLAWRVDIFDEAANSNGEVSSAELFAERTLSGVPRAAVTEPWQLFLGNGSGDTYLENQINIERFGADLGDFYGVDDAGNVTSGPDGIRDSSPDFIPQGNSPPGISNFVPLFDFNFAPYETRAWTNWPDDTEGELYVPHGPGARNILGGYRLRSGATPFTNVSYPLGTGNPRGNPGFGDSRWLRDSEPRRLGAYYDGGDFVNFSPFSERYTHWTHLSWIPTAQNGWRVCYDISNVASFNPGNYIESQPNGSVPSYSTGPSSGYTLDTTADAWTLADGDRPYHDAAFPVAIQTPYEQWYPNVIPEPLLAPDGSYQFDAGTFLERRDRWFSSPVNHFNGSRRITTDSGAAPGNEVLPNYLDLNLLGPESDRFVFGTDRNVVERTFADADGDGFTDSFWFVSPHSPTPGVKQVVGVSVVDNGGMLNANVATVFDRWTTSGSTPADAALVSRLNVGGADSDLDENDTWIGLLGDPKNQVLDSTFYPAAGNHQVQQVLDRDRWFATPDAPGASRSFLNERGLDVLAGGTAQEPQPFYGQYRSLRGDTLDAGVRERTLWNTLVQNEFTGKWVDESSGTPQLLPFTAKSFGFEDELELRSFAGLNHPTRFSRLEGALGDHVTGSGTSFSILRGDIERPETGPVRTYFGGTIPRSGKNINEQQVRDVRHRMTLFSGARNEYRPLWLWKSRLFERDLDYDRDGATYLQGDRNDYDAYQRLQRKIDLRESFEVVNQPAGSVGGELWLQNRRRWLSDLQDMIEVATSVQCYDELTDRYVNQSYFTDPGWPLNDDLSPLTIAYFKNNKMAASLAANIEAWRDGPLPYEFDDLVARNADVLYLDPPLHPYDARRVPTEDRYGLDLTLAPGDLNSDGVINFEDDPRRDGFLGFEKQPFIMQAFYALVYPRTQVAAGPVGSWPSGSTIPEVVHPEGFDTYFTNASPGNDTNRATDESFVDDRSKPAVLIAVQLGNPFDEPISLYDYALKIGDKQIALKALNCPHALATTTGTQQVNPFGSSYYHDDLYLGPTEPDAPRTAVVFALVPPSNLGYTGFAGTEGDPQQSGFEVEYEVFKQACLDYLDLQEGDLFGYEENMSLDQHQSLVLDASRMISPGGLGEGARERLLGYNGQGADDHQPLIQLIRTYVGETAFTNASDTTAPDPRVNLVVDRLQHQRVESADTTREVEFSSELARFFEEGRPPEAGNEFKPTNGQLPSGGLNWSGIRLDDDQYYMTWASISRFWGWDVDGSGIYDLDEISPRYVYSVATDPILGLDESGDLTVTGSEDSGYDQTQDLRGDTFARSSFADGSGQYQPGLPGNDQWIRPFAHTAPLTRPTDVVEQFTYDYTPGRNAWEQSTAIPAPWIIRGKPFNFPTWTVVDSGNPQFGGIGAAYDNGFPLLVDENDPQSTSRRTEDPLGTPINESNYAYIPMDLVAEDQAEFHAGFREDLWNEPLQMLLKDDDFEQIGELNHVFLWGPVIDITDYYANPPGPFGLLETRRTFAELMTEVIEFQRPRITDTSVNPTGQLYNTPEWWGLTLPGALPLPPDAYPAGRGVFANRLDFSSGRPAGRVSRPGPGGASTPGQYDPGRPWRAVLGANLQVPAYQPLLPAGAGIFDGVTIDGRGVRANDADYDGDGSVSDYELIRAEQDNSNLARGFSGEPTRGLINVNTASPEVLRALPQMSRLIYNDYFARNPFSFNQVNRSAVAVPQALGNSMHLRFAEAIERYRLGDFLYREDASGGFNDWVPSYADRGYRGASNPWATDYPSLTEPGTTLSADVLGFYPGMRNDAGIVSLGELLAMDRTQADELQAFGLNGDQSVPFNDLGGATTDQNNHNYALDFRLKSASVRALGLDPYGRSTENGGDWRIGYGARQADEAFELYALGYRGDRTEEFDPFSSAGQQAVDARVSTDRNTERRSLAWLKNPNSDLSRTVYAPDMVGGDAEEANLLFSGIANMLTTRSDVFTVYFTVRSFKQDPATGYWDATDKEMVIDESRYVMVIDRSTVEGPTDQPRVLAFSKVE